MKIYTKSGDKGNTSIIGGERIKKSDARVCAYGSVDEVNSWVGKIISELDDKKFELLKKEGVEEIMPTIKCCRFQNNANLIGAALNFELQRNK